MPKNAERERGSCLRIVIKGTPPTLNRFSGRENAWAYRQAKQEWTLKAWAACRQAADRPKEPYQYAKVSIMYYFARRIRHDADNYSGKLFMDGLTKAGVIVDDDMDHIKVEIAGGYDKRYPRTEITIEEVER